MDSADDLRPQVIESRVQRSASVAPPNSTRGGNGDRRRSALKIRSGRVQLSSPIARTASSPSLAATRAAPAEAICDVGIHRCIGGGVTRNRYCSRILVTTYANE